MTPRGHYRYDESPGILVLIYFIFRQLSYIGHLRQINKVT
jgi:hypothetical protein